MHNNKKNLYIIGSSGLGREMESWLELIPEEEREWEISGYLDININDFDNYPSDFKIVGNEQSYSFSKNDIVLIAIADPKIKERIFNLLKSINIEIMTYIAPNVIIGKFCKIGEGSIICPNCVLTTNIDIGVCTFINCGSQIGHDVIINDFSSLNANIDVAGKCQIGKGVFIGSNAIIIPSRKVGDYAVIGAGSVLIRNVKAYTTVFGNPATRVHL